MNPLIIAKRLKELKPVQKFANEVFTDLYNVGDLYNVSSEDCEFDKKIIIEKIIYVMGKFLTCCVNVKILNLNNKNEVIDIKFDDCFDGYTIKEHNKEYDIPVEIVETFINNIVNKPLSTLEIIELLKKEESVNNFVDNILEENFGNNYCDDDEIKNTNDYNLMITHYNIIHKISVFMNNITGTFEEYIKYREENNKNCSDEFYIDFEDCYTMVNCYSSTPYIIPDDVIKSYIKIRDMNKLQ